MFAQTLRSHPVVEPNLRDEPVNTVRFRLVLRGALPPDKRGTVDVKQRIRRELNPQLRTLWQQHPMLKGAWTRQYRGIPSIEHEANEYAMFGFRFVPLVRRDAYVACSLNVILLRRDNPRVLTVGGDLDNRVKTLIDGLRMPQQRSELGGHVPGPDEDPFFCLLQDDGLITEFSITTDRLLLPSDPAENEHDVVAIIGVEVTTADRGSIAGMLDYGFFHED